MPRLVSWLLDRKCSVRRSCQPTTDARRRRRQEQDREDDARDDARYEGLDPLAVTGSGYEPQGERHQPQCGEPRPKHSERNEEQHRVMNPDDRRERECSSQRTRERPRVVTSATEDEAKNEKSESRSE